MLFEISFDVLGVGSITQYWKKKGGRIYPLWCYEQWSAGFIDWPMLELTYDWRALKNFAIITNPKLFNNQLQMRESQIYK